MQIRDELIGNCPPFSPFSVFYNDDDDNTNDIIDSDESSVSGENDLLKVKLDILPDEVDFGKVSLSCTGTGIRIWTSEDKNELLLDNQSETNKITWDLSEESLPDEIFVEIIKPTLWESIKSLFSTEAYTITLKYTYEATTASIMDDVTASDTITLKPFRYSIDLDIDSDNDNGLLMPDQTIYEDIVENYSPKVIRADGRLIPLMLSHKKQGSEDVGITLTFDSDLIKIWSGTDASCTEIVSGEIISDEIISMQMCLYVEPIVYSTENGIQDNNKDVIVDPMGPQKSTINVQMNSQGRNCSDTVSIAYIPQRRIVHFADGNNLLGVYGPYLDLITPNHETFRSTEHPEMEPMLDELKDYYIFNRSRSDWDGHFGNNGTKWVYNLQPWSKPGIPHLPESTYSVILVGFSHGADASRMMAYQLGKLGCDVNLLFLIDPIKYLRNVHDPDIPLQVSDNVMKAISCYQRQETHFIPIPVSTYLVGGEEQVSPLDPIIGFHRHPVKGYKIFSNFINRAENYCVTSFHDDDVNNGSIILKAAYQKLYKEAHIWPYHSHTPEVVIGWPDIGYWVNDPSDNSDNTDLGFNMLYNEMILID